MRTPFLRREAGSLTNRTVTVRTIPDFKHPRTGCTALLLPATTEFLVIDLIAQHDPQTNAQLAGCRHAGFPQPLLHQFAAIESLQLGRLVPNSAGRRKAGTRSEALSCTAGSFYFRLGSIQCCLGLAGELASCN